MVLIFKTIKTNCMIKKLILTIFALLGYFNLLSRSVVELRNWSFHRGNADRAQEIGYDDSAWEKVRVPHDWAIAGPFDMTLDAQLTDDPRGVSTGTTGALPWMGTGWYRTVVSDSGNVNERVFRLEIDGAMSNAEVYVNGKNVGNRPYGYTAFALDITSAWKKGQDNVIAIRLNNEAHSSRWYPGAGLYRMVRLVSMEPCHIPFCGIHVTTTGNLIRIETSLSRTDGVKLVSKVLDACGKVLKKSEATPDETGKCHQMMKISQPQYWTPETPVCYTIVSEVWKDGCMTDAEETRFGFRDIGFDPEKGFFLNGVRTKFKGVCMHHDLGPLGTAVNVRALERRLEILKDMGCNAIRTSHNPPSRELVELCDKMGFMMFVEAFDEWATAKCVNGYHKYFHEWAEKDLKQMVKNFRNSPSIIMWSLGNEVPDQKFPSGRQIAKTLYNYVKEMDSTRPVTCGFDRHIDAIRNGLTDEVDIVGFNYKSFDYVKQHQLHPDYVLFGSETASTVSSRGIYKFPVEEIKMPFHEDFQLSSYDYEYPDWACTPDTEFIQQDTCDFLMGEFVWTGFDYLGEPTPFGHGAMAKSSYFGIVDLAGLPKDRYYLYRSRWNDREETLHLLPHWTWPGKEGRNIPVYCYTTYREVELFVNGVSQGRRSHRKDGTKYERYRLMWNEVAYIPGELKAVAYDEYGKVVDVKSVKTAGNPCSIRLKADKMNVKTGGDDLVFIEASVVDKDGNPCPDAARPLFFKVTGAGSIAALCNGNPVDQTPFGSTYMKTFSGKLVAMIKGAVSPGDIKVQVISHGLEPCTLMLKAEN